MSKSASQSSVSNLRKAKLQAALLALQTRGSSMPLDHARAIAQTAMTAIDAMRVKTAPTKGKP